jgi:hypothetical protein
MPMLDFQGHQFPNEQTLLWLRQFRDKRLDTRIGICCDGSLEAITQGIELMQLGNRQLLPIVIDFRQFILRRFKAA